jgi:hypothetical protein
MAVTPRLYNFWIIATGVFEFAYLALAIAHFFERRASFDQRIMPLCSILTFFFLAQTLVGLLVLGFIGCISFVSTFSGRFRIHRITGTVGLLLFTSLTPLLVAEMVSNAMFHHTGSILHAFTHAAFGSKDEGHDSAKWRNFAKNDQ